MDPYVIASLLLCMILGVCVAIMFAMRDRQSIPPHLVSQSVWCERHRRHATVDFIESVSTGLTLRVVQHCTVRETGERCGEACRYRSAARTESAATRCSAHPLAVFS